MLLNSLVVCFIGLNTRQIGMFVSELQTGNNKNFASLLLIFQRII